MAKEPRLGYECMDQQEIMDYRPQWEGAEERQGRDRTLRRRIRWHKTAAQIIACLILWASTGDFRYGRHQGPSQVHDQGECHRPRPPYGDQDPRRRWPRPASCRPKSAQPTPQNPEACSAPPGTNREKRQRICGMEVEHQAPRQRGGTQAQDNAREAPQRLEQSRGGTQKAQQRGDDRPGDAVRARNLRGRHSCNRANKDAAASPTDDFQMRLPRTAQPGTAIPNGTVPTEYADDEHGHSNRDFSWTAYHQDHTQYDTLWSGTTSSRATICSGSGHTGLQEAQDRQGQQRPEHDHGWHLNCSGRPPNRDPASHDRATSRSGAYRRRPQYTRLLTSPQGDEDSASFQGSSHPSTQSTSSNGYSIHYMLTATLCKLGNLIKHSLNRSWLSEIPQSLDAWFEVSRFQAGNPHSNKIRKGLSEDDYIAIFILLSTALFILAVLLHRPCLRYFSSAVQRKLQKVGRQRHSVRTGILPSSALFFKLTTKVFMWRPTMSWTSTTRRTTTRTTSRSSKSSTWRALFLLTLLVHQPFVASHPGHSRRATSPQDNSPPPETFTPIYREIMVHRLHRTAVIINTPVSTSPDNLREVVGLHLHLHRARAVSNNFQVHQIQSPPSDYNNPLMHHVIVEGPGDRTWHHSLVLYELIDGNNGGPPQREVLRIPSRLHYEEFIDYAGLTEECIYSTCYVRVDGRLWLPQDRSTQLIRQASLVSVTLRDDRDFSCRSSSRSSYVSSRPRTRTSSAERSDESMMMQTTQREVQLQRAAHDHVYRMILARGRTYPLPTGFGITISVWPVTRHDLTIQNTELRVWLDNSQPSWTEQAQQHLGYHLLQNRDANWDPFEEFHITTPPAPTVRVAPQSFDFIAVQRPRNDVRYLLIDFWVHGHPIRAAVGIPFGTTLAELMRRTPFRLGHTTYQMTWSVARDVTIIEMQTTISLPNGAFAEVHPVQCQRQDTTPDFAQQEAPVLLQIQMQVQKVFNSHRDDSNQRVIVFRPYGHSVEEQLHTEAAPEGHLFAPILIVHHDLVPHGHCCTSQHPRSPNSTFRPPCEGLPPPGNPQECTHWLSFKWDAMDQAYTKNGTTYILDYVPSITQRPTPTPCRNEQRSHQTIQIAQLLEEPSSPLQCAEPKILAEPTSNPEPEQTNATLDLQLEDETFFTFLDFNPLVEALQTSFPEEVQLHPSTQEWLHNHPSTDYFSWDPGEIAELQVYTDGTFSKGTSAWAFAITQSRKDGQQNLLGYASKPVSTNSTDRHWIGSVRHSAATAETEALLWATWWTLRMTHSTGWFGPITFNWDSTCAGLKAQGTANHHNYLEQGTAGERLRSLQQALAVNQGPGNIHHRHIKAHCGNPLNELVDVMAKHANVHSADLFQVDWPVHLLVNEFPQGFTWLWLYLQAHPHLKQCRALREPHEAQYEEQIPLWDNGQLQWQFRPQQSYQPTETFTREIFRTMSRTTSKLEVKITTYFDMQIATYNALSLGEHLDKLHQYVPGRVQLLRQLCHERRLHVVGLQEARSKQGTFVSDNYIRFCAGKETDGTAGVELWFSRMHPFGTNNNWKPLFFDKNLFHVRFSSSRLLIVNYDAPALTATFIVGHAPHNGRPESEKEKWWTMINQYSSQTDSQLLKIFMLDANARIDTRIDAAFGGRSEDVEDSNSDYLRDFANTNELIAPSTFDQWHNGANYTWQHPAGNTVARLDYILLPRLWHQTIVRSWIDDSLHSGHPVRDHLSVCLQLTWQQATPWTKRSARHYDRKALTEPANKDKINTIFENLPTIPWNINATEHATVLVQHIQQKLCELFPANCKNKAPATASQEAQNLHTRLSQHKRHNRTIKKKARDTLLRLTFSAWCQRPMQGDWRTWVATFAHIEALTSRDIQQCAQALRHRLQADRKDYLDNLAREAAHLNTSEIFRALRPVLQPSKRASNQTNPLPTVKKADGQLTTTLEEYHARWLEHFAAIEAGHHVQAEDLIHDALQRQHQRQQPSQWTLRDLPSLHWLEKAARKIRNGRAAGPDDIPGEVLKTQPAATARALLPLLWKLFLRIEEPIPFKGGTLIRLWKHRGALNECSSFRGILLMSTVGKLLRGAARDSINQYYNQNTSQLQMAGKPGQTVLFGSQLVRSFINVNAQQHFSTIILFGDVSAAFYRALREVATGATLSDEDICLIIKRLGLGPEVFPALADAIHNGSAYASLGADPVHNAVLNETLSETWFQMESPALIRTTRGSRPGDSLADIIFNVLFSKVLDSIEAELTNANLMLYVNKPLIRCPFLHTSAPQQIPVYQITWADDIALLLRVHETSNIAPALTTAAYQLHSTLAKHAMQLSYGKHKTAALVIPKGKGALHARRQLFSDPDAKLPVLTEEQTVGLPLISTYVHLGSTIAAKGGLLPELRARAAKAFSAFRRAAKQVYQAKTIPLDTRKTLFRSTVLAIWTWGAGAWPWLNQAEMRFFTNTTWKLYSLLICRPYPECKVPLSHDEIFVIVGFPTPGALLHEARLRHVGLMVATGPDAVWALHVQDALARQASKAAIEWMFAALQHDTELPPPCEWSPWIQLMQTRPTRWKHLVSIASHRHYRFQARNSQLTTWHREMLHLMSLDRPHAARPTGDLPERCVPCQRAFKSRRAWFLHAYYIHSYQTPHGVTAKGTLCACCNKQYPSSASLRNHLRYSPRCCVTLQLRGLQPQLPVPEPHPQLPWIRVSGERLAPATIDDVEVLNLQTELTATLRGIPVLDDENEMISSIFQQLQRVLHRPMPFPKLVSGYQAWRAMTCPPGADDRLQAALCQLDTWLHSADASHGAPSMLGLSTETLRHAVHAQVWVRSPWTVLPAETFFLHFFSGRRRRGDLQAALEECPMPPGRILSVLSIDVQICPKRCNLRLKEHQKKWLDLVRSRQVLGLAAGPPCETWSRARGTAPLDTEEPSHKQPRPLRSRAEPWGLIAISAAESTQVEVGNDLMTWAIQAAWVQATLDGFAMLEHPQDPDEYDSRGGDNPSIWSTAILNWMYASNLFSRVRVMQGLYGAPSPKPTTLLFAGVPGAIIGDVELTSRTRAMPTGRSIGKKNGAWRTTVLKEYPTDLCVFIAKIFRLFVERKASLPFPEVPCDNTWLRGLCIDLKPEDLAAAERVGIGPDFYREGIDAN